MKLITFSLWGQDPKYLVGALKNAELAAEIYPDWVCRFYVGQSVPAPVIFQLESLDNVQVVRRPEFGDWRGMYWRFEAASESTVDVMISRDTDSRLNLREKAAVEAWLDSDKGFHIMRDHPQHKFPVLGGMWGIKGGVLPEMSALIESFAQQDAYGTDYKFFAEAVLPVLDASTIMIHDEFFDGIPFPTKRNGLEFVGEVFDASDNNVPEHQQVLGTYLKSKEQLFIYNHLGLGDHLDCNAMVRIFLAEGRYQKVGVFAKQKYASLIDFMYRDEPRIEVITIPGETEAAEVQNYLNDIGKGSVAVIGHQNYPWGKEKELGMGCAEIFYKQVGIPYERRFSDYYVERDPAEEDRVFNKLNPNNEEYIFVHDDPSRGFIISQEKLDELAPEGIKVIRNDMEENIFHFGKILENATQVHCMESCFRSLAETLNIKGKLYFHNFREGASGYLGNSTQQPWEEITWD